MHERLRSPWLLVGLAALAMGTAGTYQFVWSSIRPAIAAELGASEAALGTVFTVYVITQTLSQFPAGRFRDRHGPRLPLAVGGVLVAAGYAGAALAPAVWVVYVAYAVGGAGVGFVYTVAINTPVKWFTERRGLATGVVSASFSGVSVAFIPVVRSGLARDFAGTLLAVGAVAGVAALLGAAVVRDPERAAAPDEDVATDGRAMGWREAVRTWQFWVLYAVFVVVNAAGLMLIGKAVAFTEQFGFAAAVATGAASVVALSEAGGIVALGGLSDRLGRERTVAVSVTLAGVALVASVPVGAAGAPLAFVGLLGASAFFRAPVFSVVPALVGEYYGPARSSENYALLYTAKMWGGVGGGVAASVLIAAVGWEQSFLLAGGALAAAGALAGLLRPV